MLLSLSPSLGRIFIFSVCCRTPRIGTMCFPCHTEFGRDGALRRPIKLKRQIKQRHCSSCVAFKFVKFERSERERESKTKSERGNGECERKRSFELMVLSLSHPSLGSFSVFSLFSNSAQWKHVSPMPNRIWQRRSSEKTPLLLLSSLSSNRLIALLITQV